MKILIGVPTRGQISLGTVEFLSKQTRDIYYATSAISVVHARRKIVEHFMSRIYDALLFLDDDVAPPLDTIRYLRNHNKDFVSGNYPTYIGGSIKSCAYILKADSWERAQFDGVGCKKVDGVGLGCALIKREVFEKVGTEFSLHYEGGEIGIGEDLDFSNRVRNAGFNIYCDFNIVCDHYKNVSIKTIWDRYCIGG